tara:strand:- start:2349 stop:2582 length:234 start_codon:yes stop_codon:yes gene_type:complete
MKQSLNKKDVISLVMSDVADHTEGRFSVDFVSDGGGNHIEIRVENHEDAPGVLKVFFPKFHGYRVLVLKVPKDYIED